MILNSSSLELLSHAKCAFSLRLFVGFRACQGRPQDKHEIAAVGDLESYVRHPRPPFRNQPWVVPSAAMISSSV